MNSNIDETDTTVEVLIRELSGRKSLRCADCAATVGSHQMLMNIALGFKDVPRCLGCLAKALGRDAEELRDQLIDYLQHRECYRIAWEWADQHEGPEVFGGTPKTTGETPALPNADLRPAAEWDAGDMGCGDLVLELRLRLQALGAGEIMKVCARDPGAPEDLPAWCRLTGNVLLRAEHPTYWIKRKE